jgi:predicted amidohydrolase
MIIIGGSYYENEFNTCPTIIDGAVFYIQKANPSPNFENKRGGRGMRRGNENFVFQTEYGKFSVLICFDYRKELSKILDNPDEKIKNVDFIIVPEYNKDIETFQTQADADCRKEHFPYILQVNVGKIKDKEIGGTCIIGTEHEDSLEGYEDDGYKQTEDRIKYKLIEALGEMMVIVDLDIKRKGVPVPASGDKMNPIGCYIYRTDKWIEDKINIWL